jgi:hypothetical protein
MGLPQLARAIREVEEPSERPRVFAWPRDKEDHELVERAFNPDYQPIDVPSERPLLEWRVRRLRLEGFAASARKWLGFYGCTAVGEIVAVRKQRARRATELRAQIRKLDRERTDLSFGTSTATRARRAARVHNALTRLRRELLDITFDAQLGRNEGVGGRPPSQASEAFALFTAIAEMLDVKMSDVVREVYRHVTDAEPFIRGELASIRVWRTRHRR